MLDDLSLELLHVDSLDVIDSFDPDFVKDGLLDSSELVDLLPREVVPIAALLLEPDSDSRVVALQLLVDYDLESVGDVLLDDLL